MAELRVITGVERRRIWTHEQKCEILAEAFAPGAIVEHVAQRHNINRAAIYRWRKEFASPPPEGFAPVVVAPPLALPNAVSSEKVIEILIGQPGNIRIPLETPADLAAAVIKAALGR
jgi:transposase